MKAFIVTLLCVIMMAFSMSIVSAQEDHTEVIRDMIHQADVAGSPAYIDGGDWHIYGNIIIPDRMRIEGSSPDKTRIHMHGGAKFIINKPDSAIEKISIYDADQDPYAPVNNTAIEIGARNFRINEVVIVNHGTGIRIEGDGSGSISHVRGFPSHLGIDLWWATHIVTITDVEFWPVHWPGQGVQMMENFTKYQGTAIRIRRADNPKLVNFFCLGYSTGAHLISEGDARPNGVQMVNVDFDICAVGIKVDSDGGSIMGTNVKYWGSNFWGDSMLIQGNNNTLMFTNVETNVSWSDAIRITGNNNVFYGVNLYMKRWDMANWGFPWLGDYGTGNDIQTMFVRLEP